jgi:16S rRNA (cytidine1402-2'-O)-methyltransferase
MIVRPSFRRRAPIDPQARPEGGAVPLTELDAAQAVDGGRRQHQQCQNDPASGKALTGRLPAGLYLVATPIGNLGDITVRALETLRRVDAIACEDTRVTAKLLRHYGISGMPLIAYHDHNAAAMRPVLLQRVEVGQAVALVSDAGTPLISDPGFKLARAAHDAGLLVRHLPGANAALTGLCVSGLPCDRFLFAGFLPPRTVARREALAAWRDLDASLLFYESAPRLADALADIAFVLGEERPVAVARELTKLFEEVRRDAAGTLAQHYQRTGPPKGEIVLIVGPLSAETRQRAAHDDADVDRLLGEALRAGLRLGEAAAHVAGRVGRSRRDLYQRAIILKAEEGETSED